MAVLRGLTGAFTLFAGAFALHIVGGTTDQGWLFAIAVALIAVFAVGYAAFAMVLGRPRDARQRMAIAVAGGLIRAALTAATLWAANDRAWAWWHFPAAAMLAGAVAFGAYQLHAWPFRPGRESPSPG